MKVEHENTRVTLTGSDVAMLFDGDVVRRDGVTVELSDGAIERMAMELYKRFGGE